MVKRQHPGVPCFLYGHSTGAAIALKVSLLSACISRTSLHVVALGRMEGITVTSVRIQALNGFLLSYTTLAKGPLLC
jgi:surfactin synthase thioesterase subunit